MSQSPDLATIRRRLADAAGLTASGVADGREHQDLLPGCRSVLVFASGGVALWEALLADLRAHPAHLTDSAHPLDDFIARQIDAIDPPTLRPPTRRWIRCAAEPEQFIDFRPLAHDAGLGWPSRMGLLLHPTYGLWMGMRAACFTTEALPLDAPLAGEGPCPTCPAPCASACLGDAFREGRMQIRRCATFNTTSAACHGDCAARRACPEGAAHRYGALEMHYHYARDTGRRALAAAAQIGGDDAHEGRNPRWSEWAEEP